MKRSITLMVIGLVSLIYGGTTWAQGGGDPYALMCSTRAVHIRLAHDLNVRSWRGGDG